MPWLVAGRIVQGLGSGGLMSLSQALIGELVPPRERARFQGYFSSLFAVASIGGPVLGGVLVTYLSWQWLFWFNLPLVGIALYRLARFQFVQSSRKSDASIDVAGLILFPSMMTLIIYWLSAGGHYFPWLSVTSISLVSAFILTSLLFIAQQKRVTASFLPLRLLARREIHIPLLSTFIFAACLFALIFFLPIFYSLAYELTQHNRGYCLSPCRAALLVAHIRLAK